MFLLLRLLLLLLSWQLLLQVVLLLDGRQLWDLLVGPCGAGEPADVHGGCSPSRSQELGESGQPDLLPPLSLFNQVLLRHQMVLLAVVTVPGAPSSHEGRHPADNVVLYPSGVAAGLGSLDGEQD